MPTHFLRLSDEQLYKKLVKAAKADKRSVPAYLEMLLAAHFASIDNK